jgi:MFS superfamily sulfate permease-like transporter
VSTILLIVCWGRFAPKGVRWIPAALVAVATTTAAAALLNLPVRYVELPENIFASIAWTSPERFLRALEPGVVFTALAMAVVASAETLLSANAVDQMHSGRKTRYNKELMSQGFGNVLCGAMGALPMTGVIVRSATNIAGGAQTRLSAVLHGVWMLLLVALLPWTLRLIPTAALAAILVYTGYKLVNPANVQRLVAYGGAPVAIYLATVIAIVAIDLLTGIVVGLLLSMGKLIYARSRMKISLMDDHARGRTDLNIGGAASFLRLPVLTDALEKLPAGRDVHVHHDRLEYIDHAALEVLSAWERERTDKGQKVYLEWSVVHRLYRESNPMSGNGVHTAQKSASGH